jgi:beta-1,4-mannosyltransferase
VIDWHNYGYSILAMKLSNGHPLVKISQAYEKIFARTASAHIAVTKAMANSLRSQFALSAPIHVLHDRPADFFKPFSMEEKQIFSRNSPVLAEHSQALLSGKKRLLVSSTSWTPDEDFSILIEALCEYSTKATSAQLPEITAIITGKGPQKDTYLRKIAQLSKEGKLEKVTIESAWLSFEDYAALLASADLGVSLHTSSSGVDLPMKVVDMFGAGLPVIGWSDFEAWPELVTEDVNGKGFTSSQELAECLKDLFRPGDTQLEKLKQGAIAESTRRWDKEWDPVAGGLFGLVE